MYDKYQKMSVKDLADKLEQEAPMVVDKVVDSRSMTAVHAGPDGLVEIEIPAFDRDDPAIVKSFPMNDWAHGQMSQITKIPKVYYDRMRENERGQLLADNINAWQPVEKNRLVKTVNGTIRAILSDRYKTIDNLNILRCTMEKLVEDFKGLGPKFVDLRLGDTRMYMKAVMEQIQGETRPGDYHSFGFIVTNSEVGATSLKVEPYLQRTSCSNSMIKKSLLRKIHSGPANHPELLVSAETRLLQDAALYSEFQDAIATCLDRDIFDKWMDDLQATTEVAIAEPTDALQNITTKYKISEKNAKLIEDFFFKEEDCTQYGLIQGITRAAQELTDYDEAIRWEAIAGDLSEMNEKQFVKVVA